MMLIAKYVKSRRLSYLTTAGLDLTFSSFCLLENSLYRAKWQEYTNHYSYKEVVMRLK